MEDKTKKQIEATGKAEKQAEEALTIPVAPVKKKKLMARYHKPADEEMAEGKARLSLTATANAAMVIKSYSEGAFGEQDMGSLMDVLSESYYEGVGAGNMQQCEAMLFMQANALQAIFMGVSRRAVKQDFPKNYDTYLRLALKAQAQCTRTLEALAMIKNPPVVFAKQANISHGPQQINNGVPSTVTSASHAREEKTIQSNELLEHQHHGEWLDNGKKAATSGTDTAMAAVETQHRSAY